MRVGVGFPNTVENTNRDQLLGWAQEADRGPFSSLGVLDRLVYDSYEPLTTLAAAAAVTSRVGLATIIVVGPLRNTALLAKAAATVNALSKGRLILGLAIGARDEDYAHARVPYHDRGARFNQQLAVLRDYLEDEAIGPRANQTGGPPLLIGGSTDLTFARVARFAEGYVHGGGPPRAFVSAAASALTAWQEAGRPGRPQLWGMGYFALGSQSAQTGADYLRHYYAFTGPFAERIAQGLLTTPQAVAQFVREYQEAGCDELILFPTSAEPDQLQRLADVLERTS